MHRQYLSKTSGRSFFQRFRNGIQTLDDEINKLESINIEQKPLPKSYFQNEANFLANIDNVKDEVIELNKTIRNLIDITSIEKRLMKLEERLDKFEQNPKVLASGYKPFKSNDVSEEEDSSETSSTSTNNDELDCDMIENFQQKLSFVEDDCSKKQTKTNGLTKDSFVSPDTNTNTETNNSPNKHNDSISSTLKKVVRESKMQQRSLRKSKRLETNKVDNPLLKRALDLCKKWIDDDDDHHNDSLEAFKHYDDNSLSSKIKKTSSVKKQNILSNDKTPSSCLKSGKKVYPDNSERKLRDTPSSRSSAAVSGSIAKNKKNPRKEIELSPQDDYETVEFTPGMTTRVRRASSKTRT